MRLAPFKVQFTKEQIDRDLWSKLRAEAPGILAWAVEGCLMWQREGLEPPKSIADATASYRAEQDIVAEFLNDCTDADPTASVGTKELYQRFRDWCKNSGESDRDIPKQRWFTERMKGQYKITHRQDGNHFLGVRLRSSFDLAMGGPAQAHATNQGMGGVQ